mgnify:CR=1 FL=1
MHTLDIGARVKELRKKQNITLSTLAEQTGLSVGFLSKLEHDQTSPTIANLHKICEALHLTLNDILSEDEPDDRMLVVRKDERPELFLSEDGKLQYASITRGSTLLQATAIRVEPDAVYPLMPHTHDELGIVVSGMLEMVVDGKPIQLQAGDTIYLRAGTMHSLQCRSEQPCESYWVKIAATAEFVPVNRI